MASTIYPKNRGCGGFPRYEQAKKEVCLEENTKARHPDGHIIAKGNSIAGIEAKK